MLGYKLKTNQTTEDGVLVSKVFQVFEVCVKNAQNTSAFILTRIFCYYQVMIAQALDIAKETYFAILMDRDSGGPVMVGSPDGGVDIEHVAATNPSHIFKVSPTTSIDQTFESS